jgi:hypothetical protein
MHVPGVEPTCTENGWTSGVICAICGETLVEPEEIPALGHTWITIEGKEPQIGVPGYETYMVCNSCDAIANTSGEILDGIPVLDAIIDEDCEMFFTAHQLSEMPIVGIKGSNFASELNEEGGYTRFYRTGEGEDGFINLIPIGSSDGSVTGQYMVIKYRTDHMKYITGFASTAPAMNGGANYNVSAIADSDWHITVIDLSVRVPEFVLKNDNGEYAIQWFRIDVLDSKASEGYFDIAWVALCDDPSDVSFIISEEDQYYCDHSGAEYEYNPEYQSYTGTCKICNGFFEKKMLYVNEAATSGHNTSSVSVGKYTDECGTDYVKYTCISTQDPYFYLIRGNMTEITGQYMIIRYRLHNDGMDSRILNSYAATTVSGLIGANGRGDRLSGNLGTLIGDGEWHYLIIDLYTANQNAVGSSTSYTPAFIPDENGEYAASYVRVTIAVTQLENGGYTELDVDYVGFADNFDVLNSIASES